jgi:hypothetical protein
MFFANSFLTAVIHVNQKINARSEKLVPDRGGSTEQLYIPFSAGVIAFPCY